jgi:hypothetical protein
MASSGTTIQLIYSVIKPKTAQPAAAADPHSRSHRTGSTPVLIARGAGFGQGSARKRRIAIIDSLLK